MSPYEKHIYKKHISANQVWAFMWALYSHISSQVWVSPSSHSSLRCGLLWVFFALGRKVREEIAAPNQSSIPSNTKSMGSRSRSFVELSVAFPTRRDSGHQESPRYYATMPLVSCFTIIHHVNEGRDVWVHFLYLHFSRSLSLSLSTPWGSRV